MTIALDVGTHRLKVLRCEGDRLVARACRTIYASLPDSAARRQMLERIGINTSRCGNDLVVLGDSAANLAKVLQVPCLPLLSSGRVPDDDPAARQMLGAMIDQLLGEARETGEYCCLVVPQASREEKGNAEFFSRLARLQGYRPLTVSAGMAVVLAETVHTGFTGIGVSLGSTGCEISLAHRGVELSRASVSRGTRWIDERLANCHGLALWDPRGQKHLDVEQAARTREMAGHPLSNPTDEFEEEIAKCYRELMGEVARALAEMLGNCETAATLPQPLAVVVSGGPARATGMGPLLERTLRAADLPVRLGEVRVAADSDFTIARGCLINAELEHDVQRSRAA